MNFSRLPPLPATVSVYGVAAVAATLVVLVKLLRPSKLDAIPTVGSTGWGGSWWAGFNFSSTALDVLQEGCDKFKSAPFKVSNGYRWLVVISSPEHVEELRKAPDDALSLMEAVNIHLHIKYTMGPHIHHNPFHISILRSRLTRNIGALYADIRDEVATAFDDVLDLRGNEWKSVPALTSMKNVVCRTSNRLFVGLPLCRDPDWIDLNIQYTNDVVKASFLLSPFPEFLKPVVTRLFTNIDQSNLRATKLLGPIIEERQGYINEYKNEWTDKPNDFLSWLMDEAEGPERTIQRLATRVLAVNFAAVHASANSFTHALFYLAANPQYIQPLRDEVEAIVGEEGWSKTSLGKMRKIDSFMKESQRFEGVAGESLTRKALKDYTFSDGTFVPKGAMVTAAARHIHHDEALYEDAHTFKPFRFADLRDGDGEGVRHQFAATTTSYLPFGYGRHACPGRFFAANELTSMLAHVVMKYDVRLEDGATKPSTKRFRTATLADPRAKVLFRRRVE